MRYVIGTVKNHISIEMSDAGLWVFIHNEEECLGFFNAENTRDLRLTRTDDELMVEIGRLTFWVKATRLY